MIWHDVLLRMGLAIVLGAMIGIDREWRGKPAGMRTYALVAMGAATFTVISLQFMLDAEAAGQASLDPLRLVSGIVGGIGFLGAGTIIQARGGVEGITTAAGIWVVGGIGVACGAGFYMIALVSAGGVLVVLLLLSVIEHRLPHRHHDGKHD